MDNYSEVELMSTEPSCVKATRDTIEMLPGGVGAFVEQDGRFYIRNGFTLFAAIQQGYVKGLAKEVGGE